MVRIVSEWYAFRIPTMLGYIHWISDIFCGFPCQKLCQGLRFLIVEQTIQICHIVFFLLVTAILIVLTLCSRLAGWIYFCSVLADVLC